LEQGGLERVDHPAPYARVELTSWPAFQQRDVSQVDYAYLSADGLDFNIRLEHEPLCAWC
jgi:hypothetical protein